MGARARGGRGRARTTTALWDELCELGWPGIAVREEHGGQGLGAVELAVLLEELGYACAATPFLSTAAAAAAIQAAGSDAQRARWLPALASGEATAGIGTRALCADGVGARVLVLLDGDVGEGVARRAERHDVDAAGDDRPDAPLRDRQRRRRRAAGHGGAARAAPTASARRSPPRSSASRSARSR